MQQICSKPAPFQAISGHRMSPITLLRVEDERRTNAYGARKKPRFSGLSSRAGERIRTVDIQFGNVRHKNNQAPANQGLTMIPSVARSKYAARNNLRIRRVSAFAVGEWPRDPDHARAV